MYYICFTPRRHIYIYIYTYIYILDETDSNTLRLWVNSRNSGPFHVSMATSQREGNL